MVPEGTMGPFWPGDSPFWTVWWGRGAGLQVVSKFESSALARAMPSEVYPAGKLQKHFTCGFHFRHSL